MVERRQNGAESALAWTGAYALPGFNYRRAARPFAYLPRCYAATCLGKAATLSLQPCETLREIVASEQCGSPSSVKTGHALLRFGAKVHPVNFYAGHHQRAFPIALVDFAEATYASPAEQLVSCYEVRTSERGLNWLGLLAIRPPAFGLAQPEGLMSVSPLLRQLFEVPEETS